MNPFARLIDPTAPVPQPSTLQGRVHVLADEIDHTTMLQASKPGQKPQQGTHGPVQGLPRFEVQYRRDESSGYEAWFPVPCWVPTEPAPVERGPLKNGARPKPAPVLADASIPLAADAKLKPTAGPGPTAYRVRAA